VLDMFQGQSAQTKPTNGKSKKDKQDTSAIITLRPNKQRTQGKKNKLCLLV
jgi:hypothetical protein